MSERTLLIIAGLGLLAAFSVYFVRVLGDLVLRLAGAETKVLHEFPVDRNYHLGLGLSLLLSSAISTVALLIATSVGFGVKPGSATMVAIGAVYFFLIFSIDRWLVSDQTAGYASEASDRLGGSLSWTGNFLSELFKFLPRLAVVFFASALFADFILLVVFDDEIKEQMKLMSVQATHQFDAQVAAEVARRVAEPKRQLTAAVTEKKQVQTAFDNGVKAIKTARDAKDKAIAKLQANGVRCRRIAIFGTRIDSRGQRFRTVIGHREECPTEVKDVLDAYDSVVDKYPGTQQGVAKDQAAIDKRYDVAAKRAYITTGAEKEIREEWSDAAPTNRDGLLVRMRALDLLTSKPSGTCNPAAADASFAEACISRYSGRADTMQTNLRIWILLLELLPVLIKFVNALLPRRGYASLMAALDEKAKAQARLVSGHTRARVRVKIEEFMRQERTRMELTTAGAEIEMREMERQRQQAGKRMIRQRMHAIPGLPGHYRSESGPDSVPTRHARRGLGSHFRDVGTYVRARFRRRKSPPEPVAVLTIPQQFSVFDDVDTVRMELIAKPVIPEQRTQRVVNSEDDL